MPYDDPDPTDPMTLHSVVVETRDNSAMTDMAECFIDEYARLGFDADRILHLFNSKGFAGPYMAARALGEDRIRELVERVLARWGGRRDAAGVRSGADGSLNLTVLGEFSATQGESA
ncbi:MAG: hypothetical protein A49_22520 [Methyloceanibacter sp.]|nr:MAG: hypothetical protein A49_22520 [Methyloceanibacter sp.]